jgi:outer membrane protein TolC
MRNDRSLKESPRATELSAQDARYLAVLAVTGGYLQVIAWAARVESARAQVAAGRTTYQQAVDRHSAGLSARIDHLHGRPAFRYRRLPVPVRLRAPWHRRP